MGIGAWSWGDRTGYWGWENQSRPDGYGEAENRCAALLCHAKQVWLECAEPVMRVGALRRAAYQALVDAGVTFLDTAEGEHRHSVGAMRRRRLHRLPSACSCAA